MNRGGDPSRERSTYRWVCGKVLRDGSTLNKRRKGYEKVIVYHKPCTCCMSLFDVWSSLCAEQRELCRCHQHGEVSNRDEWEPEWRHTCVFNDQHPNPKR